MLFLYMERNGFSPKFNGIPAIQSLMIVYTLRLYYYNIEDLSEEDFEQRQKNISTMIQINIGFIILIIGLYFIFSSKPQEVVYKRMTRRE